MMSTMRKLAMTALCFGLLTLSACLPEEQDANKALSSATGRLSAEYYASGLGNVAVQIQNAIISDPSWSSKVDAGWSLDLAAFGLSPDAMGAPVKSAICSSGGTQVTHITWIDGRDSTTGNFQVRGIGTNAAAVVNGLRSRLAGDQVGTFSNGTVTLAHPDASGNSTVNLTGDCATANIPAGAPVVVLKIDRPAVPASDMARTEYRTMACDTGSHGTRVEKRVVTYKKDGTFETTGWQADTAGNCVPDIAITVTDKEFKTGEGSADLSNFAAVALKDLLAQKLQMDCTQANISKKETGTGDANKALDTCGLKASGSGAQGVTDTDTTDQSDTRILDCAGVTAVTKMAFVNLLGTGTSTTTWRTGTATLVRVIDKSQVDISHNTQDAGRRAKWIGTDISCGGDEYFTVTCDKVPGAPATAPRVSNQKWYAMPVLSWGRDKTWFPDLTGICFFGSCTQMVGGIMTFLNFDYFTGTDLRQYVSTTTRRDMGARTWIDPQTFKPLPEATSRWTISDNQCTWSTRVAIVNCPYDYDPSAQGNWLPTTIVTPGSGWNSTTGYYKAASYPGLPVALDPGVPYNGTKAGLIYVLSRAQGYYTSSVLLQWQRCNIKGCSNWFEYAGPGENAYIKSWTNAHTDPNLIYLTSEAQKQREDLCGNIAFQLNASEAAREAGEIATQKGQIAEDKKSIMNTKKTAMDAAQAVYNDRVSALNIAKSVENQAKTDSESKRADATAKRTTAGQKTAYYNSIKDDPSYTTAQKNAAKSDADAAVAAATTAENDATQAEQLYAQKQTDTAARQNEVNASQTTLTNATTAYNTAKGVYDQAKADADAAAAHAKDLADQVAAGWTSGLTQEQKDNLRALQGQLCASTNESLNLTEQESTTDGCTNVYDYPDRFGALADGATKYCDAVFDKTDNTDGTYSLSFHHYDPSDATYIQTTLLNKDGVLLAHRPQVENNTSLTVRQNGFYEPLHCGRNEEKKIPWTVLHLGFICGGKGGCQPFIYATTENLIEAKTREWKGYSYADGTWSIPTLTYYMAGAGTWDRLDQVPNPILSSAVVVFQR
ncbi:MAG: hypothetical protein H6865_02290 [Rhodospirillales bacterium]|nr:hypothetical protein [Alphaproteobacteria bacterium]MCB9986444.1 hypothetical protein [Rhodospirillales bacterium]USO07010.1 MAG: hypothetical protein H6866_06095 [Rhodospirillales bacterium]